MNKGNRKRKEMSTELLTWDEYIERLKVELSEDGENYNQTGCDTNNNTKEYYPFFQEPSFIASGTTPRFAFFCNRNPILAYFNHFFRFKKFHNRGYVRWWIVFINSFKTYIIRMFKNFKEKVVFMTINVRLSIDKLLDKINHTH